MKEFDPYFDIDLAYEREQQKAEDREDYITSKVAELLEEEWDEDFEGTVVEAVRDRVSSFDDAQWAKLEKVLIKLALGHTASSSDTEKLLSYSDLCIIAEGRVVRELILRDLNEEV